MSLRARFALALAIVAIATAGAIALATPLVITRGFDAIGQLGGEPTTPGQGQGSGQGQGGPGRPSFAGQGQRIAEIRESMVLTIVVVAGIAAAVASLGGLMIAGRLTRPIRRLEETAAAVAGGDLARRSGLASRDDELGDLGRSFDEMAASLERAEDDRRRFMQDVVHELRTPLAVVEATTSAVLDGVYAHDDEHLRTVRDQSRLLSRIVDDLRTISLAEGGHLELRPERVGVAALLRDAARNVEARAASAGIAISLETVDDALAVRGDHDRLRQVLAALLDNALRHTPAGGRIVLAARGASREAAPGDAAPAGAAPGGAAPAAAASRGAARLEVRDSGPGIAPEDLPLVFERLYQADPARDRRTGSSGLGLAIVRALVEAQGGRVGAGSAPEGGALLWLELPLA